MKEPPVIKRGAFFVLTLEKIFWVLFLVLKRYLYFSHYLIYNQPIIMKKILLPLILMATMFACKSPESKTAASTVSPDDKEAGSFVSIDDKTAKFTKLLEAAMKNDTAAYREIMVDTIKTQDGLAENVDSLNQIKTSLDGIDALLKSDSYLHTLYDDIKMTTNSGAVKTFTFADGRVLSGYWGIWTGKGKFTKKDTRVPLHMIAWWEGDKIVKFYRTFDPASLKAEIEASKK
jgi:hypothetical protein